MIRTEGNMKVLIVPMTAMAETSGPGKRCRVIAEILKNNGIDTATCMARDVNYVKINGIRNYDLEIPTPLGMPGFIAGFFFPLIQKTGIAAKKTVSSFDQVLYFTGNLNKRYLKKSVEDIRKAIRDHKADIVYSEFNISAIIAAKLEKKKLFITVSYPTQKEYACDPKLAKGINQLLSEVGLPQVSSALELFDRADERFCPSIPELEPFQEKKVTYIGALGTATDIKQTDKYRNKILVYMGNGTVPAAKMLCEVSKAFEGTPYEIYIASHYLKEGEHANIHVAKRWDFNSLLNEAVLFINHGGQNSMMDGLLHGVPQLVVPGKVFERKYNAAALEKAGAGRALDYTEFKAQRIKELSEEIISSKEITENAKNIGSMLHRKDEEFLARFR